MACLPVAQERVHEVRAGWRGSDGIESNVISAHRGSAGAACGVSQESSERSRTKVAEVRHLMGVGAAVEGHAHAQALQTHTRGAMQQDDLLEQVVQEWEALCHSVAAKDDAI